MALASGTLRIGGVPEHFNEPWLNAIEETPGTVWKSFPGGTGAMCEALSKNDIDCALVLTEGALKYCLEKQDCELRGVYVDSPLIWGVHVGAESSFNDLWFNRSGESEVVFAISRFGSGSHLMAYVLAKQMSWSKLRFEVVGNLKGAQDYLSKQPNALFMWEKAMTDPLVKQKVFKRIGETPTPWPCFVLATRKQGVNEVLLNQIMRKVWSKCEAFKGNKKQTVDHVVAKFGIEKHLVEEWFDNLRFSRMDGFNADKLMMLETVKKTLIELGQIPGSLTDKPCSSIVASNPSNSRL